ncbi:MAG: hypothetical protein HRT88_22640 [Lentisphaeraceae bacterium]|nr:hypothetical protein [Lentisphaeraceae bacterium]
MMGISPVFFDKNNFHHLSPLPLKRFISPTLYTVDMRDKTVFQLKEFVAKMSR